MSKLKIDLPKFHRLVQISSYDDLDNETMEFLLFHASKPLDQIDIEETNDFLNVAYHRFINTVPYDYS